MIRISRSTLSWGGIAVAAALFTLAVPRAAHAVAAALVQVTNTASSPVIAQGIGNQAAQIVQIECTYLPGGFPQVCVAIPATGIAPYAISVPPYVVPAGQTLVVTAVDVLSGAGEPGTICNSGAVASVNTLPPASSTVVSRKSWAVPAEEGIAHFVYPSGILFAPGTTIVDAANGGNVCTLTLDMHGYLTAQ